MRPGQAFSTAAAKHRFFPNFSLHLHLIVGWYTANGQNGTFVFFAPFAYFAVESFFFTAKK